MRYCRLHATQLSWMYKCPMARHLLTHNCGYMEYQTPRFLRGLRDRHDDLALTTVKALRLALRDAGLTPLEVEAHPMEPLLEAYALVDDSLYHIRGRPDALVVAAPRAGGGNAPRQLNIVVEATLNRAHWLLAGEMAFYTSAAHLLNHAPTLGVVVHDRGVEMRLLDTVTHRLLKRLLTPPSLDYSHVQSEALYHTHPWACSLCDLSHHCPVYQAPHTGGER